MATSIRLLRLLATAALLVGCHQDEHFESVGQVVGRNVVDRDERGTPILLDVELEWDPCPGDQFQVIRGGREFAACMLKHDEGEIMPVKVTRHWDNRGYHTWAVTQVGDCGGDIDGQLEGSYEKSQECSDLKQYGNTIGFECSRKPFKKLVAVCPFMAR